MSVAICNSSTVSLPQGFGSLLMPAPFAPSNGGWLPSANGDGTFPTTDTTVMIKKEEVEEAEKDQKEMPPRQVDIWTSIQAQKAKEEQKDEPYVHPLVRRSSSLLSQKSLEICTESLGSETGTDNYFSSEDDMDYLFSSSPKKEHLVQEQEQEHEQEKYDDEEKEVDEESDDDEYVEVRKKELATVNYHCSIGRRSPARSFPPPLPSISNRSGPCFQMRPHRKDGRLVVEAVAVPSQNYLHSERQGGRLVLSFIHNTTSHHKNINTNTNTAEFAVADEQDIKEGEHQEEQVSADDDEEMIEMEDEEEEEEVEVVDRGTVVEVTVSTQPQQQNGCAAAAKVHRSSIVINKFVSCTLPSNEKEDHYRDETTDYPRTTSPPKRTTTSTTTAAAAAVAASSLSTFPADANHPSFDNKLLFTSKRRNSEELLRDMRRCNQLRKPLFIWEPCCIATSS